MGEQFKKAEANKKYEYLNFLAPRKSKTKMKK